MESCMKLLFPEFDHTDIETTEGRPSATQPTSQWPTDDEQPCCSKDLEEGRREGTVQNGQEEKSNGEERQGVQNKGRTEEEDKMERCDEKDGKHKERGGGNKQEEEEGMAEENMDENKGETRKREEEEEGQREEEADDENLFMRSSGLISHSYTLDLNLNPGW